MEAHHLRLRAQQHRQVLATDFACSSLRLGNRTQAFRIVVRLQALAHRLACLRCDLGLRPERIVDVQAAAALLPETGNATFGILGGKPPHSEAAEAACIAHRGSESGRAEPAHRRLEDGPLEIKPLGEGVSRPHGCPSDHAVDDLSDSRGARALSPLAQATWTAVAHTLARCRRRAQATMTAR